MTQRNCDSSNFVNLCQKFINLVWFNSLWQYASRFIDIPIRESFIMAVYKQTYWYTYMWVIHHGSMQADLLIYLYVSHSSWQYASRPIEISICESFIMTVCKQTYWYTYMWVIHHGSMQADLLIYLYVSHSSWQYASRLIDIPICESFIMTVCKQTYWYTYMWVIHRGNVQADLLIYLYVSHSSWQYASRLIDIPICESFIVAICKQTYWYTYMWVIHRGSMQADL